MALDPTLNPYSLAVAKGQVVVVNAYVRLASGNPELGYGLYDKDGNALDSKAALLRLGKDWALVTLVHKASVTHPFVQFAWLPGAAIPEVEADPANGIEYAPAIPRGIIDATDAVCMVLADENTPLPLSIPRVQRTHGLAKIPAGATDVTVIHGLPFAPPLPPMLSYPGQFGGTGGTQDRFFVTIPAAVQTDTYISWSAEPY
ncbi:hypothetical protein Dxin01_02776 [Deinococcus xinjiangensis]|uniref:Uncharacterized protein n=1 Tax=Deinococcus xinjiangensis TaxID=457454 RepID=A0ABP9VCR3_9DEIO